MISSVFSKRDQFCSFWDQFFHFAHLIRLGDYLCAGITFAAVQGLMRVYTYDLQIVKINKDLRERENKKNSGQEILASSGPDCFLSP